jgi:hypothetical protein
MIRFHRPTTIPASLSRPAVQAYLTSYAAHVADPVNFPKPDKPSAYRNSDLLDVFETHFFAKCYLTEEAFNSARVMDVDHFAPANQYPTKVFDWDNLFPASHQANMMRPRTLPPGGLLNPCQDDVEADLLYFLDPFGEDPGFKARDPADVRAVNTADLLYRLHNGTGNAESAERTKHLRVAIRKRFVQVIIAHRDYLQARVDGTPQELAQAEHILRELLSRRKSFTMLMRSIPAIYKTVSSLFD